MTAEIDSLVLEHLRAIRAKLDRLEDRMTGVEVHLSTLGQQVGALTTAIYSGKSDMDEVKRRIDRIERRLELSDPAH